MKLDARADRADIRDRLYQPPLVSLPHEYPSKERITNYLPAYRKAGLVLDQGEDGACTGFGLGALINYLLFAQSVEKGTAPPGRISTRMLYHLARKYDEWPGEDYEGSSCRGAMKGWFHHGVCEERYWPYLNPKGQPKFVKPVQGWDTDAAKRPVGAYYRVTTESIADMQAAINEVGAVYVSSDVHGGWDLGATKKMPLPVISWKPGTKPDGGHAYALVGYDADGFIVQNSWGEGWGYFGFAKMLYDDWLTNGDDAWVAVMGAPINAASPSLILSTTRTVASSARHLAAGLVNGATAAATETPLKSHAWDAATATRHALILGNDGQPEQVTIDDENAAAAVDRVTLEFPQAWLADKKKGERHIAIYQHGGLNGLSEGFTRTELLGPWFFENGVYPIFVVWQSSYFDSIVNIFADVIGTLAARARDRKAFSLVEVVSDARDRALEVAAIPAARPVWSQMKQNAAAASTDSGGMVQLAKNLGKLANAFPDMKIHLVGHSAGAVGLGAFLTQMKRNKIAAETLSLYAPACTVAFALETYLPAAQDKIINPKKTTVRTLSDALELADTVGPYGRSLLYLVSRALESAHKTPILGMEAVWNPALDKNDIFATDVTGTPNSDVAQWRAAWAKFGGPKVLTDKFVLEERPKSSIKSAHGCFDNWIGCIEETLVSILGLDAVTELPVRVSSLKGI